MWEAALRVWTPLYAPARGDTKNLSGRSIVVNIDLEEIPIHATISHTYYPLMRGSCIVLQGEAQGVPYAVFYLLMGCVGMIAQRIDDLG